MLRIYLVVCLTCTYMMPGDKVPLLPLIMIRFCGGQRHVATHVEVEIIKAVRRHGLFQSID
jgi:hypothetical protein